MAAAGAIGTGGFWAGHHWAAGACDAEKLQSQVLAQQHQAAAIAHAQATSDKIAGISITLNTDLAITRTRQKTIIEEVAADVDAHPDLARCIVPADTQRLRDGQVRDSEQSAADSAVQR
jgi:hypothetical protein